jgi:FMN phosphatase YigB (HAD superfamily)
MPIDTIQFDYGGVVADHYSEPYLGLLASELGVDRNAARALLSEQSPHGRLYRLDQLSKEAFWEEVRKLSRRTTFNNEFVQELWAKTYIPNAAVLSLIAYLRNDLGLQIGVVMNEDRWRYRFIMDTYCLDSYLDVTVASFQVGALKPEAAMSEAILRLSNRLSSPDSVLYVDDRQTHVDATVRAGMRGYQYLNAGELSTHISQLLEAGQLKSASRS